MSTNPRTNEGTCYCGAVRFRVTQPSLFCAHCHCDNCRRAHGAAFVTWVGYATEHFAVIEGADDLTRFVTPTGATRRFCRRCGTTLLFESPRWSGEVHVVRSNIDGEIDRAPETHVYVDHRAEWWTIDDDLPQRGGTSGVESKV